MVFDREFTTQSARETSEIGRTFARSLTVNKADSTPRGKEEEALSGARIICLYGELGSGKTTFVQGFARGIGITTRLLSPTFIIVRRYPLNTTRFFYHVDLYRIADHELGNLGLNEILSDQTSYVVVEWAEKLGVLLPKSRTDVRLVLLEDGARAIKISNSK